MIKPTPGDVGRRVVCYGGTIKEFIGTFDGMSGNLNESPDLRVYKPGGGYRFLKICDVAWLDPAPTTALKITAVTVSRLKSLPGYHNVSISATAAVDPDQDPESVRMDLDVWVQAQIEATSVDELRQERDALIEQNKQASRALSETEGRYERKCEELKRLEALIKPALDVLSKPADEELPF